MPQITVNWGRSTKTDWHRSDIQLISNDSVSVPRSGGWVVGWLELNGAFNTI